MDLVLEVTNKYSYKFIVNFGKRLKCLGVCWISDICDILTIDGDKVFNMLKFIVG